MNSEILDIGRIRGAEAVCVLELRQEVPLRNMSRCTPISKAPVTPAPTVTTESSDDTVTRIDIPTNECARVLGLATKNSKIKNKSTNGGRSVQK